MRRTVHNYVLTNISRLPETTKTSEGSNAISRRQTAASPRRDSIFPIPKPMMMISAARHRAWFPHYIRLALLFPDQQDGDRGMGECIYYDGLRVTRRPFAR